MTPRKQRRQFLRDFVYFLMALRVATIGAIAYQFLRKPLTENHIVDAEGRLLEERRLRGDVHTGKLGDRKVFLIRDKEAYLVLSAFCSHKRCTVKWDQRLEVFRCPCHGARYDKTGQVLQGPAREALERLEVIRDGNYFKAAPVKS